MTPATATSPDRLDVTVAAKTMAADGVVQLRLRRTDGAPLPSWAPGAHIDVVLPGEMIRQYSLHGDPADLGEYLVSVLYERSGRGGSRTVHEQLRAGDRLAVSVPKNHFALVDAPSYLFIAGGIGITPILPMLRHVAALGRPWRLIYGGRTQASMAHIKEVTSRTGGRIELFPQDETGLLDVAGILDESADGDAIYCCGPAGLLEAVEKLCTGDQAARLHIERFTAGGEQTFDRTGDTGFELVLNQTGRTLTIPPDRSIMDVILEETSLSPFSCGEGYCGTCEAAVLEGTPDHRDSILSDEERADNRVMYICVGRSRTPRLVIDL